MTNAQLRRAALYLEADAATDLRSRANPIGHGKYEWPDDPGYGYGSAYKKIYEEKIMLAKALRSLSKRIEP